MRKEYYYLSVIWILILYCGSVSSQVGIKAGIGISDIIFKTHGQSTFLGFDNKGVIHDLPKLSFQAGLFTNIGISNRWKLQPELLFSTMGIDYSTDFFYEDITYRLDVSYLQIPMNIEYLLRKSDKSNFSFYLGPYLGLKLNSDKTVEIEGAKTTTAITNVKSRDYGLVTGCSYKRNLNRGVMTWDFRIGYGLINMMDPVSDYLHDFSYTPDEYARNVSIMVTAGYRFNNLFHKSVIP